MAFTAGVLASHDVTISNTGSFTLTATKTAGTETGTSTAFTVYPTCGTVVDASYAAASATSTQVTVYWSSANAVLILRESGGSVTGTPVGGQTYSVGGPNIGTSTVVYSGSVAEGSFLDTGQTAGRTTTDRYKVYVKGAGCYSPGLQVDASVPSGTAWSHARSDGPLLKPGIAGGGALYIGGNGSKITSLSTTAGTQSWDPVASSGAIQSWLTWVPLSSGGTAVIGGDQGGKVYSVNSATGAKFWTEYTTGEPVIQAGVAVQLRAYSTQDLQPGYTGDIIFAASMNGATTNKIYAIKASDGGLAWSFNGTIATGNSVSDITGMPYVDYARNRIYVTSKDASGRSLWVINSLTGSSVACNGTDCTLGSLATSPTLSYDGNTLYIGDTAGRLHAINAGALTLKWTLDLGAGANIKTSGFVWEDYTTAGRLYFTTADGNVRCVKDNGQGLVEACPGWTVTNVPGAATPLLLDKLFVGSSDGTVRQINPTDGTEDKRFPAAGSLDGTSLGAISSETGNEIFVGTNGGKIFKINLTSGALP